MNMIIACVNCYKHHTVHYGLNECPECGKELFLIDTREDDIENIASMMNDARDNDTIRKEVNNFKQESNMTIEQEVEEEANRLFDLRQRKDHPDRLFRSACQSSRPLCTDAGASKTLTRLGQRVIVVKELL